MGWRKVKVAVVMTVMVICYFCFLIVSGDVHSITKTSTTRHQIRQRQQQQQQSIIVYLGISDGGGTRFSMGFRNIKQNYTNNAFLRSTTNLSSRQLDMINQQSLPLMLRGGGGNEKTIEWLLTNDPKIFFCGSIFSFVCLLYGAACAIDPRGTARLLYGHEKMAPQQVGQNNINGNNSRATKRREALIKATTTTPNADDSSTIKFLMRSMGSTVFGLGLMAAFSISLDSNQRSKGTSTSYFPAMAIGILPRSLLYFWYAFIKAPALKCTNYHKSSTENPTSPIWVTVSLFSLMYILQVSLRQSSTISVPYGMALVLTPTAFALLERYLILPASLSPSSYHSCSSGEHISDAKKIGTRHEVLFIRQLLLFSSMYAVMVLTLLFPNATNSSGTTSFPAIGLSALTMFLTQIILSVKDYKDEDDRKNLTIMKPSRHKFGWNDVATWMALWIGIVSLKGSHMDVYSFLSNLYRCPCND